MNLDAKPLLIGAYWYPWYGADGRHWREGYRDTPLLGEYDSGDVAAIDRQVAWAVEYGVETCSPTSSLISDP